MVSYFFIYFSFANNGFLLKQSSNFIIIGLFVKTLAFQCQFNKKTFQGDFTFFVLL